jgi:hypothetical protein
MISHSSLYLSAQDLIFQSLRYSYLEYFQASREEDRQRQREAQSFPTANTERLRLSPNKPGVSITCPSAFHHPTLPNSPTGEFCVTSRNSNDFASFSLGYVEVYLENGATHRH